MDCYVLTGAECTGKSTLIRLLATNLNVPYSVEFSEAYAGRIYPREIEYDDVSLIIQGQVETQLAVQKQASRSGHHFFLADTDLVSTLVYSEALYGKFPSGLDDLIRRYRGHDYFLLSPEHVPWEDRDDRRQALDRFEMYKRFKQTLTRLSLPFRCISCPTPEGRYGEIVRRIPSASLAGVD